MNWRVFPVRDLHLVPERLCGVSIEKVFTER